MCLANTCAHQAKTKKKTWIGRLALLSLPASSFPPSSAPPPPAPRSLTSLSSSHLSLRRFLKQIVFHLPRRHLSRCPLTWKEKPACQTALIPARRCSSRSRQLLAAAELFKPPICVWWHHTSWDAYIRLRTTAFGCLRIYQLTTNVVVLKLFNILHREYCQLKTPRATTIWCSCEKL